MQNQYDESLNMSRLRTNTRKMKQRASRRRARGLLLLIAAVVLVVLFLTPVFDIRTVDISGTVRVGSEQTDGIIRSVVGKNLFTVEMKDFKANLEAIPYIKSVDVDRKLYPPSLKVLVTECIPVAYVTTAGGFVMIDAECKILEVALQPPADIPQITGLSLKNPVAGQKIEVDETDKSDIIEMCIINLAPISAKIRNIDVTDTENISFEYDNRLRVVCGSSIDFGEKIKLFNEAINSNRLASNARGTMDLSNTGKAVYTP